MQYQRIGITGASGFIGKSFVKHLQQYNDVIIVPMKRPYNILDYDKCDALVHLGAINKGASDSAMFHANTVETMHAIHWAIQSKKRLCVAGSDHKFGMFAATKSICAAAIENLSPSYIDATYVKLPHVFGAGCKPNYNSFVTTLIHHIVRDEPFWHLVRNKHEQLNLMHVSDVCEVLERMARNPVRDLIERELNRGVQGMPTYNPWHDNWFRMSIKDFVLVAQGKKCEKYSHEIHKRITDTVSWYRANLS